MKNIFLSITLLCSQFVFGQQSKQVGVKTIPNITVFNLNGTKMSLPKLASNKITFIDFWFIPCGPCFAEMGMLHRLYDTYKNDTSINFMTITFSDSAFVRDLVENRNSDSNDVYDYFKTTSALDTFRLPVYFIDGYMTPMRYFKSNSNGKGFSGKNWPGAGDKNLIPDQVFTFSAYPTILIFDTTGKLVFSRSGFTKKGETQEMRDIQNCISGLLLK